MGGTSVTPEVFRTVAPTTGNTYWRMFQGGPTAAFERGQLFAEPGNSHFNLNAPNGNFLMHTQNVARARLSGNVTGPMGPGNPYPGVNRDGYFLLSGVPAAFTDPQCRAPFTRLHLVDQQISGTPNNYAQQQGFRLWQRNGITFTGNNDQSYIGQKYDGTDITDLVIQWSDNPEISNYGTDRMKFIFTTLVQAGTTKGAASEYGLEAMRLYPETYDDVNLGIGDFHAGNLATPLVVIDPTERVDILDGRLRIRDLPDDPAAVDSFYVMVVDRTVLTEPNQERGVVKWVPPSIFTNSGGGSGCEWTLLGSPGSNSNIATAYTSNPGCPQEDRYVGIGTPAPYAKLHVEYTANELQDAFAGIFTIDGDSDGKRAGRFLTSGTGAVHYGVQAKASGAISDLYPEGNIGVSGEAVADADGFCFINRGVRAGATVYPQNTVKYNAAVDAGTEVLPLSGVQNNYGVRSIANNAGASSYNVGGYFESWANPNVTNSYGVWGVAAGGMTNWAGYFSGSVLATSFVPSDAHLKTAIEDVGTDEVMDVLNALQVHRYEYATDEFPGMHLPEGTQVGLLAQELEELLPGLVKQASEPAHVDETGEELSASVEYKAVNYVGLIPYLIAGHQAQEAKLAALQADLADLRSQLAACCNRPASGDTRSLIDQGQGEALPAQLERMLQIQPNPFNEQTTLSYTLENGGRMQLMANSADGKQLQVLTEAQLEAGQYRYEWNTSALSPGVYYVTLLLNGQPLVKKAVKVQR